jgi:hypothetical protein
LLISVPKNQKKASCEVKGVISLLVIFFFVIHERCEDIFCATNQILQIQRMSENNKSATQNADVGFQLRAICQQLELLSRTYKDLKDEVNSIKQQNSGADRRGNTV